MQQKGGSMIIHYSNSLFPRSGDCLAETSSHTTGIYGFMLQGESLLSAGATNKDNYKFDVHICESLPEVVALYRQDLPSSRPSRIVVRRKESMDTGLWQLLHRQIYCKPYQGKLVPEPVYDPITSKMLKGLLMSKINSVPGQLSSEAVSIDFQE